ncbi:hypothetical protein OBBRIDRAFT_791006 [Obba rivulosa]|uniref:Uncharacterized protein n=1 Tax=Obba rivulosa TaxID=1052685 RepID=A0A8E2B2Z7_9APHY|nr:hypothetical protein OBBRIDRAFT_791006 [Obba rivulosa]
MLSVPASVTSYVVLLQTITSASAVPNVVTVNVTYGDNPYSAAGSASSPSVKLGTSTNTVQRSPSSCFVWRWHAK